MDAEATTPILNIATAAAVGDMTGSQTLDGDSLKSFLLEFDDSARNHLVNFYEAEVVGDHCFRWSEPVAMVRLDVPASDYQITIETASLRCGGCLFPFRIFWNDQLIPARSIRVEQGQIKFTVTRGMFIRNDEQRMTFSCKPLNAEKGRRQLGIPIKWIRLDQTGTNEPEFANPTKSRSRLWRPAHAFPKIRKLIGLKSPSPILPIWEMKLPNDSTSVKPLPVDTGHSSFQSSDLVIVSSVEINSRHGTGLLIQFMFKDFSEITTVSSKRCFDDDRVRSARHFEVPSEQVDRHQIYELVLNWFKDSPPARAFVVPYYRTELLVAIAMADLFGTRVCLHVMDDQCLLEEEIPLSLMAEAMDKASLVFVISPEMRDAYRQQFKSRTFILPPVVPQSMLCSQEYPPPTQSPQVPRLRSRVSNLLHAVRGRGRKAHVEPPRGILIGNVWNEQWLQRLQSMVAGSGHQVDWYSNNPDPIRLAVQKKDLLASGIHLHDPIWGDDLVQELRRRPYAIMPSSMLGADEKRASLARLSLPSRLPFVMSVANIPIVVLGSQETAAGRFVNRFQLGAVIDYEPDQFRSAINQILEPDRQRQIRNRAGELAQSFSAERLDDWIGQSIQLGQPVDQRFESLFQETPDRLARMETVARAHGDRNALWKVMRRLANLGLQPDLVINVGSGDGGWSWAVSQIFTEARYLLIEPQPSQYSRLDRERFQRSLPRHELFQVNLGGQHDDRLTGVLPPPSRAGVLQQPVQETANGRARKQTLDELARSHGWSGSSLLKFDARIESGRFLAGGMDFIKNHVDVIMLTVSLAANQQATQSCADYHAIMEAIGFRLIDETDAQRCPRTDILLSSNLVFARSEWTQKKLAA